jgi:hypothetical protein
LARAHDSALHALCRPRDLAVDWRRQSRAMLDHHSATDGAKIAGLRGIGQKSRRDGLRKIFLQRPVELQRQ